MVPDIACVNRIKLTGTTVFRLAMRYAGFYSLLTAICLGAVYGGANYELHHEIDTGLGTELGALQQVYAQKGQPGLQQTLTALATARGMEFHHRREFGKREYALIDSTRQVLAGTFRKSPLPKTLAETGVLTLAINKNQFLDFGLSERDRESVDDNDADDFLRVRAMYARLADGDYLLVGQSLDEVNEFLGAILLLTLLAIVVILAVGIVGGLLMSRSVLRRLGAVTDTADRIMTGDLARRIPGAASRDDEFALLGEKLNAMLERIELLMRNTREVTENVAHDLRSPLTRLRGSAEMALLKGDPERQREALRKAIEQTDTIVATLNAILNIAQIESGAHLDWTGFDITAICNDAAELYEALAESKSLHFESSITPGISVRGNRQLIAQAIGNLLDNAIKYTPAPGRVSLRLEQQGGHVEVTIADSGPGIPAELHDKVLERFTRLDTSRSQPGNGLGLSLVKAIISQHGATLSLFDNRPGLIARITFVAENQQ